MTLATKPLIPGELGVSGASKGRMGQDHLKGPLLGDNASITFG